IDQPSYVVNGNRVPTPLVHGKPEDFAYIRDSNGCRYANFAIKPLTYLQLGSAQRLFTVLQRRLENAGKENALHTKLTFDLEWAFDAVGKHFGADYNDEIIGVPKMFVTL